MKIEIAIEPIKAEATVKQPWNEPTLIILGLESGTHMNVMAGGDGSPIFFNSLT
jgi:hypothetical protein